MTRPPFVKITGPGRYQLKPYGRAGWIAMGAWVLLLSAVMALLFVDWFLQRWWIVSLLSFVITIPLIVFAINTAVPIEDLNRDERRHKRGRRLS